MACWRDWSCAGLRMCCCSTCCICCSPGDIICCRPWGGCCCCCCCIEAARGGGDLPLLSGVATLQPPLGSGSGDVPAAAWSGVLGVWLAGAGVAACGCDCCGWVTACCCALNAFASVDDWNRKNKRLLISSCYIFSFNNMQSSSGDPVEGPGKYFWTLVIFSDFFVRILKTSTITFVLNSSFTRLIHLH